MVCPREAKRSRGHGYTQPMSELGIQEAIPTPPDPDEALGTQFSLPCSANKEPGPGEEAAAHPGPRSDAWRRRAAMKAWHPPTQLGVSYGPEALPATLSPARNLGCLTQPNKVFLGAVIGPLSDSGALSWVWGPSPPPPTVLGRHGSARRNETDVITVLGVCHPAVEADVPPGPSGVGVTLPVPASRGQRGVVLGEGAVRKGRGRLGSTNPQALDWGWREAERASRAPQCPVPSDWRPLPYAGCRSNAEVAGMGAASTCPEAGELRGHYSRQPL